MNIFFVKMWACDWHLLDWFIIFQLSDEVEEKKEVRLNLIRLLLFPPFLFRSPNILCWISSNWR